MHQDHALGTGGAYHLIPVGVDEGSVLLAERADAQVHSLGGVAAQRSGLVVSAALHQHAAPLALDQDRPGRSRPPGARAGRRHEWGIDVARIEVAGLWTDSMKVRWNLP